MTCLKCILGNEECSHCLRWKQCNFYAEYTIASQLEEKVAGTSKLVNYQRNAKIPYSFYKSRRGFPVLERKPVNVNIRFWRRTILVSSGPTQVLTRVYFNEGVFERQIKKVRGERRCKSMEALYLGPLGLLYKVQVLHENFLWGG
jgi:hypothetical protein